MLEYKPLYQAMLDAVSQTLENMAFTEVSPHFEPDYLIPEEQLVWTYLMILDPLHGEIRLALAEPTLAELTCAMFAQDEGEINQEQKNDLLSELLNTIAGLFMTNLLDDNQPFKIGLPEHGKQSLPQEDEDTICWNLMTGEENPLQIYLTGVSFSGLKEQT